MTPRSRPPRFARWLLARVLPADVREDVTGDMHEMFVRRASSDGARPARRWYRAQTVSFIRHFLAERFRRPRTGSSPQSPVSWIDLKLAVRMLVRYPGLTAVSVAGIAVGIAIAAAAFTIARGLLDPELPLDEGERVVSLIEWDSRTNNRELRILHDYLAWRSELRSVDDIGAFRTVTRNLMAPGAQPETVTVAEMNASGFRVARVQPAMGRYFTADDERTDAADVVVIGDAVWRRRFNGDPGILGKVVQLGETTYTIAGVMPQGFAFPVAHGFWVPLRLPASAAPLSGPPLSAFARLAPGATVETAAVDLGLIGRRATAASPQTHEHLQPRVVPYTYAFTDMDDPDNALALHVTQTMIVMLLALVCVNVAILVYARTATRQGEIAVRSALGASRRRITLQLFLEALVLAGAAALVGIGFVAFGLRQLDAALDQVGFVLPFWMTFELSLATAVYVVALAVFAAAIIGVVPAVKATSRRMQERLQGLSAGSGSRMQMGRLWTVLIVAQVGIAVTVLPATVYHAWTALTFRTGDPGIMSEFLTTELTVDRGNDVLATDAGMRELQARYGRTLTEFERVLEQASGIAAVTSSLASPGGERAAVIEVEGLPLPLEPADYNIVEGTKQGYLVRFNRVAQDFFSTFSVPLLTGRTLGPGDVDTRSGDTRADRGIVVDRAFVTRVLSGENPLGRRVRYVGRSREAGEGNLVFDRWYEIVGVVADFPAYGSATDGTNGRIYHVARPGDVYPAIAAVRTRGIAPSAMASRVREVGASVDPGLQLQDLSTADDVRRREQGLMRLIGGTLAAVTLSVIVLSTAGIYALMSFTVARRRKEIGIRTALGAEPVRILTGIFKRAAIQLAIGAGLGMIGSIALEGILEGETYQGQAVVVVPAIAACTVLVGLLAALGPARRGLAIQPTEALREE